MVFDGDESRYPWGRTKEDGPRCWVGVGELGGETPFGLPILATPYARVEGSVGGGRVRRGELEGEHGGASLATGDNLQADPPWLRGSSDCRVGQAPMQAVHGFPGASPFPILQRRRLPPRRQPTSLSGKRHHDGSPPEFSFLSQDIRGPGCPVCINSSLPTPELSISPPGRWPAVEVPNSRLTGPLPTRHHVFVVANLALTSH